MGIPDPPSHKSCVEYNCLYKSVPRSAQRFILIRFIHAPCGIGTAVQKDTLLISVYEKTCRSGQYVPYDIIEIFSDIHLHIRHLFLYESFRVFRHILLRHRKKRIHDLQHNFILNESVNIIEHGRFAAYNDIPPDNIKTLFYRKDFIHISDVLLK